MHRAHSIAKLVNCNGWTHGVELGVWQGETLFTLLSLCPKLHMIGVDQWRCYDQGPKSKETGAASYVNTAAMKNALDIVNRNVHRYDNRVKIIRNDTQVAATHVPNESVDFVFIDANHMEEAVRNDIRTWIHKIKRGGAVIGHDYNWPAVQRAVHSQFEPEEVLTLPGNCWLRWVT